MSEKRKRPNFKKEFKQDAVKLVDEKRYSRLEAGRRLFQSKEAFRSLKSERTQDYRFVMRWSAEMQILDRISYYNSIRLHSTMGYKTPLAYEKELCRLAT